MSKSYTPKLPSPPFGFRKRHFRPALDIEPREFTLFPKLPPQLRLKIWAYALPDPRIITIKSTIQSPEAYRISYLARVPSKLLVNRESRDVALKRYSLRFTSEKYGPGVYFNLERDVFCVKLCRKEWWTDFNDEFNKDLSLVKRDIIQHWINRPLTKGLQRATPFYGMSSLGLVDQGSTPDLSMYEKQQILAILRAQVMKAKRASARFMGEEENVLESLRVYFLSRIALLDLQLGE